MSVSNTQMVLFLIQYVGKDKERVGCELPKTLTGFPHVMLHTEEEPAHCKPKNRSLRNYSLVSFLNLFGLLNLKTEQIGASVAKIFVIPTAAF